MSEDEFQEGEIIPENNKVEDQFTHDDKTHQKQIENIQQEDNIQDNEQEEENENEIISDTIQHNHLAVENNQQRQINPEDLSETDIKHQINDEQNLPNVDEVNKIDVESSNHIIDENDIKVNHSLDQPIIFTQQNENQNQLPQPDRNSHQQNMVDDDEVSSEQQQAQNKLSETINNKEQEQIDKASNIQNQLQNEIIDVKDYNQQKPQQENTNQQLVHQNNDDEDFEEGEIIILENEEHTEIQQIQQDEKQAQQEINNSDDEFEEGEIIQEYNEQNNDNKPNQIQDIQKNQNENKLQLQDDQEDEFEDGEIIQETNEQVNDDDDFVEGNIIEEQQTQQPAQPQQTHYNISSLTNDHFQEIFKTLIQIYGVTPPQIQTYQQTEFQYNLQLQKIIPDETIQQLYQMEKSNQNASDQLQELFLEQVKHNFDIWQNYTAYQNQLKDYNIKLEPVNFEQINTAEKQSDSQLPNSPRLINLSFKSKAPKSMFFNDESFNTTPNKSNSPQKQTNAKVPQPKVEIKVKQKTPPKIKVDSSPLATPREVPVTSPVSVSNILDLIPDYSYLLSNKIMVKE